jgi:hypothetical protein
MSRIKGRIKGIVRGLHARLRNSSVLRRIALPLLRRFPQLKALLRRFAATGAPPRQVNRKALADWPGPLPEDYLDMPEASRKVLLDLARAMQRPPNS